MRTVCGWFIRGIWLVALATAAVLIGVGLVKLSIVPSDTGGFIPVAIMAPFVAILAIDLRRARKARSDREDALGVWDDKDRPVREWFGESRRWLYGIGIFVLLCLLSDSVQSAGWGLGYAAMTLWILWASCIIVVEAVRNGRLRRKVRKSGEDSPKIKHYAWIASPLFAICALSIVASIPTGMWGAALYGANVYYGNEGLSSSDDGHFDWDDMPELGLHPERPILRWLLSSEPEFVPEETPPSWPEYLGFLDEWLPEADCRNTASGAKPLTTMGIPELHKQLHAARGEPVLLALLDYSIDADRVDFPIQRLSSYERASDVHGTAVALTTRRALRTAKDVALLDVPTLQDGSPDAVADSIHAAVNEGARVINMSFAGRPRCHSSITKAVQRAHAKDVLLVAAAGNDRRASPGCPANLPEVLSVGAASDAAVGDWNGNSGQEVAVVAPMVGYCSADRTGEYLGGSGTSFASAAIAGALAELRLECPKASAQQVSAAAAASEPFHAVQTLKRLRRMGVCR